MKCTAEFSPCRTYRYRLDRIWDETKEYCVFIGLNPSTADETTDDPTIRRCIGFAKDWGFGALVMLNLFALRSTSPLVLYTHKTPEGPDQENDWRIYQHVATTGRIVCAWGSHGKLHGRGNNIRYLLSNEGIALRHFGLTKNGQPKHPLYLPKTAALDYF